MPESERPLVMTGRSTRGLFVIAGGRSYVAALIKDAGGRYAWADNTSVASASVDLEAQIQRAANADVWINGGGWKNLAAMLDDEPRYAAFKAYRQGQVWVYERRQTPPGGNDYWSRSVTHPDLVLADLVKIFHPALAAITRSSGTWRCRRGNRMSRRDAMILLGLAMLLGGVFLLSLALGSTSVPLRRVVAALFGGSPDGDSASVVVCTIRLPRSLTAMLAGAALGIAGLQMQTLFRNPLADPFALGISSGASLGVALVVLGSGLRPGGGVRHGDGHARRRADHRCGDRRRGPRPRPGAGRVRAASPIRPPC